jgi:hypothetical protein
LLTLATTIGESDVAAAPSIVTPDARWSTVRPSRTTVIVTAGFAAASTSNVRFAAGSAGAGGGGSVVDVVVVEVFEVVVEVVVDEVVVDEVVVDEVVVEAGGGDGVEVVVARLVAGVAADSTPASERAAHAVRIISAASARTID